MHATSPIPAGTSFSRLLARYIDGQIDEGAWKRMMGTFDLEGVSTLERMAYARFMNEILNESKNGKLEIPAPDEVSGLLGDVRTTA